MPKATMKRIMVAAVLAGSMSALPLAAMAANDAKPAAPAKEMKAEAGKHVVKKHHRKMHRSATVKKAQEALNRHGAKLKADGFMGHRTERAIMSFQKAHKLKVTGRLDSETEKALMK